MHGQECQVSGRIRTCTVLSSSSFRPHTVLKPSLCTGRTLHTETSIAAAWVFGLRCFEV
jgi:hypothetical protein